MEDIANNLILNLKAAQAKLGSTTFEEDDGFRIKLKVDVLSARALEYDSECIKNLQVHILFRGQTFHSEEVSARIDPLFNFSNTFDLHKICHKSSDLLHIKDPVLIYITSVNSHKLEDAKVGLMQKKILLAAAVISFKYSLVYTGDYLSAELLPCEQDGILTNNSAGVIFVRLSLENISYLLEENPINKNEVDLQISSDQEILANHSKEFYQLARSWWSRLKKKYPYLENRSTKVIEKDETGQYRFVTSFVAPVLSPRELDGPRFAARFVSLLGFQRDSGAVSLLGANRVDICWRSAFAFLSCMQGDVEEHANLLCSLLLGWGLDAWVAQGTIRQSQQSSNPSSSAGEEASPERTTSRMMPSVSHAGPAIPYCWVVTIETGRLVDISSYGINMSNQPQQQQQQQPDPRRRNIQENSTNVEIRSSILATCWESLSGVQYELPPSIPGLSWRKPVVLSKPHPFVEIHALYRHDSYLINIQKNCSVSMETATITSFDLKDDSCWLRFPLPETDTSLGPSHSSLRHTGSDVDKLSAGPSYSAAIAIEDQLELQLIEAITKWRADSAGKFTLFDRELSTILQPALVAYEWDRVTGATLGNNDFQASIKRFVRKREVFKAYPICFSHANISQIMLHLQRTVAAREVLMIGESDSRYAVRVKVFPYPEGAFVVWLMIAVCYVNKP